MLHWLPMVRTGRDDQVKKKLRWEATHRADSTPVYLSGEMVAAVSTYDISLLWKAGPQPATGQESFCCCVNGPEHERSRRPRAGPARTQQSPVSQMGCATSWFRWLRRPRIRSRRIPTATLLHLRWIPDRTVVTNVQVLRLEPSVFQPNLSQVFSAGKSTTVASPTTHKHRHRDPQPATVGLDPRT